MLKAMTQITAMTLILFSLAICSGTSKEKNKSQQPQNAQSSGAKIPEIRPENKESILPEKPSESSIPGYSIAGESEYVQKAFAFLVENKGHYKITDPRTEFIVGGELNDSLWHTVILEQYWNKVKVKGGYFSINMRPNAPLTFNNIVGVYYPGARQVDTNPTMSEEQVKKIAAADKRSAGETLENTISNGLIIINVADVYQMTWEIVSGPTVYWIDGKSGAIVKTESALVY
jgi:hypothetical protein